MRIYNSKVLILFLFSKRAHLRVRGQAPRPTKKKQAT